MDKKAEDFKEKFSGWDDYYKNTDVKTMPWYEEKLDHNIENEIRTTNINSGNFLDLGTGPGTQAIQLSKFGFQVTGTDISQSAIEKAKKLSDKVDFVVDDILESKLPEKEFDFVFDRGIFHVFDKSQRSSYIEQICKIIKPGGILFLKCMSKDEENVPDGMPHKFAKQEIKDIFQNNFDVQKIEESIFHGTLDEDPKALFAVLKKK